MSIIEIAPDRLARLMRDDVHLCSGKGDGIGDTFDACLLQVADWLAGGDGASDEPKCVDLAIRGIGTRLNDAPVFKPWRDELKPFAARMVGTAGNAALTEKRRWMCADWTVRTIAPLAFDAWAASSPEHAERAAEWASRMRAVPAIVDAASAKVGRNAAFAAYAAANATASANTAAAYAAAAAYYAAYDAAFAAYAAYAAYAAAAAAAIVVDKREIWNEALRFLGALCEAR